MKKNNVSSQWTDLSIQGDKKKVKTIETASIIFYLERAFQARDSVKFISFVV